MSVEWMREAVLSSLSRARVPERVSKTAPRTQSSHRPGVPIAQRLEECLDRGEPAVREVLGVVPELG